MVKYEIWLLTDKGYRRMIFDNPEAGTNLLKRIKVNDDEWLD